MLWKQIEAQNYEATYSILYDHSAQELGLGIMMPHPLR